MFRNIGLEELLIILLLAGGIMFLIAVFYLLTLQKALDRCSPQSRKISPGSVWLMLIPLFNIVFQFILVSRIASSLEDEFRLRSIPTEPNPGKAIGITFCILGLCGWIPFISLFASIIGLICFIIYWAKIAGFSSKLALPFVVPTQMKKCPKCAEEIRVDAQVCRFCQFEFPKEQVERENVACALETQVGKRAQHRLKGFEERWR
ncbi:MAG: hypothetical protein HY961_13470 [Ignavibacteriae bacterium]|nr:hypothetical protein [Ignavibacteriota bacterium]